MGENYLLTVRFELLSSCVIGFRMFQNCHCNLTLRYQTVTAQSTIMKIFSQSGSLCGWMMFLEHVQNSTKSTSMLTLKLPTSRESFCSKSIQFISYLLRHLPAHWNSLNQLFHSFSWSMFFHVMDNC